MTLQLAVGYTTTAVTVFLVPVWETALTWSCKTRTIAAGNLGCILLKMPATTVRTGVFSLLSPPTLLAICLLYRLYNHPSGYRDLIAGGRG